MTTTGTSLHELTVQDVTPQNSSVEFGVFVKHECFVYSGSLFMKILPRDYYNAVNLETGKLFHILDATMVTPVYNAKLTYTLTRPE